MEHEEWMAGMREMLNTMAQQTTQINASLQTVAAGVATHEQRLSYAEETLRMALVIQQGIKDILERLNGRSPGQEKRRMDEDRLTRILDQLTQLAVMQQAFNAQQVSINTQLVASLSRIEARLQSMDETLKGLLPQRRTNGGTQSA
jgi:hypothetical protein